MVVVGRGRWVGIAILTLAVLALLAAARAAILMVYLGFEFHNVIDPVSVPMSYYVFVDESRDTFVSTAVALAIGALAVLVGMAWAGVRMAGRPTVLFTAWVLSLVLAAIFPADEGSLSTFAGWVHQFAGAGVLASLSLGGLAAAGRLAEHPSWLPMVTTIRMLSIGGITLAIAYFVSRLDDIFPGIFGNVDVGGMLQRAVLAFDIGVVSALAVRLIGVAWESIRYRAAGAARTIAPGS